MNWYMIKTKDTYVSKLCIFYFLFLKYFWILFFKLDFLNLLIFFNLCEMSSFRFESSCDRDGGMWWIILHRGGSYLVVLSSRCEDFFHHESYCDESISIFLWRQFRVMETCPYMAYGRGLPIYGSLHRFLGGLKCPPPYYSKVLNKQTDLLLVTRIESWLSHIPVLSCSVPHPTTQQLVQSVYILSRNSVISIILIICSPPRYEISSVILHQINNDKIQMPWRQLYFLYFLQPLVSLCFLKGADHFTFFFGKKKLYEKNR